MALTAGIVGLPNVGKSTLFNAITESTVMAANYPFATIEPNVGIVEVPDDRLNELTKLVEPNKTIAATFEFTDIAGLVKGASKGEGLGNKFLANIREVDAICHVVRCFINKDITHVEQSIDPIRDINIINLELIIADLDTLMNRKSKIEKKASTTKDKNMVEEMIVINKLIPVLEEEKPARTVKLNEEEAKIAKAYNLLTIKPMIYVANLDEDSIANPIKNPLYKKVVDFVNKEESQVVPISAKIEFELTQLENDDKELFMEELNIGESGLSLLIKASYSLLGLSTYFTAGKQEVRAWTFKNGMTAPQAAGIIHTDFERGFIRAEVMAFDDLKELKNEQAVKEAGKLKSEGKDYIVKDGDVIFFKFNV